MTSSPRRMLFHARESEAGSDSSLLDVETDAAVLHLEHYIVSVPFERRAHPGCARVLTHVAQGFLDDTEQRRGQRERQLVLGTEAELGPDSDPGALLEVVALGLESAPKAQIFDD